MRTIILKLQRRNRKGFYLLDCAFYVFYRESFTTQEVNSMSYPNYEKKQDAKELFPGFISADESLDVKTIEDAQRARDWLRRACASGPP